MAHSPLDWSRSKNVSRSRADASSDGTHVELNVTDKPDLQEITCRRTLLDV